MAVSNLITLTEYAKGMAPEDFIRKFQFTIVPGSALTFDKDQIAQAVLALRRTGDLSRNRMFAALNDVGPSFNLDTKLNDDELQAEAIVKLKLAAIASQAASAGQQQAGGK